MRLCSKGRWKARGSPHQSSSSVAAEWKLAGFCKCCANTEKKRRPLETMGNNERYFFHIKYKLEKQWNQIVLQPRALPTKPPWFNVLCFCTTLWGPWLLPMYAHSELCCIVGRRSHPYQQWCQCFLLISLGNTQPSPPWPAQQPNLSLQSSFSLFPSFIAECNRASAPEVHWLAWLCTKKTTLVLAAMCADSVRAVGVLSNLFQSLSVSLACSLRPETVESFLPCVWGLLKLAGHNKRF